MDGNQTLSPWEEYFANAKKIGYFRFFLWSLLACVLLVFLGLINKQCNFDGWVACTGSLLKNISVWRNILFFLIPALILAIFVSYLMILVQRRFHWADKFVYYVAVFFLGLIFYFLFYLIRQNS